MDQIYIMNVSPIQSEITIYPDSNHTKEAHIARVSQADNYTISVHIDL